MVKVTHRLNETDASLWLQVEDNLISAVSRLTYDEDPHGIVLTHIDTVRDRMEPQREYSTYHFGDLGCAERSEFANACTIGASETCHCESKMIE